MGSQVLQPPCAQSKTGGVLENAIIGYFYSYEPQVTSGGPGLRGESFAIQFFFFFWNVWNLG